MSQFPRLITDNTKSILDKQGKKGIYRNVVDEKEFQDLLISKIKQDLDRHNSVEQNQQKVSAIIDVFQASVALLNTYLGELYTEDILGNQTYLDRTKLMGWFNNRQVLEGFQEEGPKASQADKDYTLFRGSLANYPAVVLGRNEKGEIYLTVTAGEESWKKQLNSNPDHVVRFIDAVKREDYVLPKQE